MIYLYLYNKRNASATLQVVFFFPNGADRPGETSESDFLHQIHCPSVAKDSTALLVAPSASKTDLGGSDSSGPPAS